MRIQIRRLKIKAVLFGFFADTAGTLALATLLISALSARGLTNAEISNRMHSLSGMLLMLIIGLGCTLAGGYLSGRIAKQEELLHGAMVAGAGLVLGLFFREPGLPLWYDAVSFLASMPAGIAGGYLARESNAKRTGAA